MLEGKLNKPSCKVQHTALVSWCTCLAVLGKPEVHHTDVVKGLHSVVTYHDIGACQVKVCHMCTPMQSLQSLQAQAGIVVPLLSETYGTDVPDAKG